MKRVAGCDLGKATAKLVVGRLDSGGRLTIESCETVPHEGRPMDVFREWYARAEISRCDALGATGLHADELTEPVVAGLPEDACLQAALARRPELDGPLNVVSVGARGYAVLVRDADGRVHYLENDKCSSGTGETMVKIAGRFGLSIGEADELARSADTSIPITARCSVFAKSEMTHFGNQGRPADALFRGYFGSVAAYVAALLERARVAGPVIAVGGAARIESFVDALSEAVGEPVRVLDDPQGLEALGALLLAGEQLEGGALDPLPDDPGSLIRPKAHRFRVLEPASKHAHRVRRMEAPPVPPGAERDPVVLGLDLGSTGSKAVLTSIRSGEPVLDLYDRTRGNPVQAAQRLVAALLERTTPDVRAVALTGSGREAAASVVRAAFPEMADRVVVMNEIVAHATAAIRCDEEGGRSISVVEIGGQDAKFIQIAGGQIVESDMNKACSAGTGSFLEEQAVFYGVHDIAEFTEMAQRAARPPDLGQMCTVFVAEAASEAHNEGFAIEDLFGGFQYSVIHNYIHRVMGQRTFGERVFFQGKPAAGPSLAWTLAAVTGREVVVPPNPGAMGAWGIGLCAVDELGEGALLGAPRFALGGLLGAEVVGRTEFQCRDKRCATLCNIDKTTVEVGGTRQIVLSGGACPKYEIPSLARHKIPKDAPSPFDERAALLAELHRDLSPVQVELHGGQVPMQVGVAGVGACAGYVPWLVTLVRELGLEARVLTSDAGSLARGEARCWSYDACAPVKIAHGVLDADVDAVLFPKLITVGDREGPGGRTCPMEQGLPEMVEQSLRERGRDLPIVRPVLELHRGPSSLLLLGPLAEAARALGADPERVPRAVRRAAEAQRRFEAELAAIGERALAYAREQRIPAVVVCGSLHVVHDPAVNAGIPRLLRDNGVLPIPMDCFPIADDVEPLPRAAWGDLNRTLRVAVAARRRGDVYPLLLTSFGCGPASFGEQVFASLMEGHPHTALESDGHGGSAGYVTRVQAFLHAVRQHDGRPSSPPRRSLATLEVLDEPPAREEKGSRIVVLSIADRVGALIAAAYRAHGLDAVGAPPPSPETLALGREDCSGKECIPYQLIWGAFRKELEERAPDRRTVLLSTHGEGRCRNCMFTVKDRLSIARMGLDDRVVSRHLGHEPDLGWDFMSRMWLAIVGWDLLTQLTAYHRAYEREPGECDAIYREHVEALERCIERPARRGPAQLVDIVRGGPDVRAVLESAAGRFAELRSRAGERSGLRTVLVSGDIYVRIDDFASDGIARKLAERGIRPIVEPVSVLAEYLAEERLGELAGLPTGLVDNAVVRVQMRRVRRALYAAVRATNPWLPDHDGRTALRASGELLDRHPQGEAPVTVGSVLHHWRAGVCDGVLLASPWGCGPALVAESLLRHQHEIPMLVVYTDGSPIDERRLNAFAFRLRRRPPRSASRAPKHADSAVV